MTKKNIMPVAVLTVICVVVAILLAVVNYFTAPIIKDNADKKVNESLYAVLPDANGFENVDLNQYENVPASVVSAHKDKGGSGHVVVVETSTSYTSGAKMSITVGVGSDGKIKGVTLNAYTETKDFGKDTYPKTFVGLGADDIDVSDGNLLVAGVTYSSKAFKAAVKDAANFAIILSGGSVEPETPETPETPEVPSDEIEALAVELVGAGASFNDVTPTGDMTYVKKIFKEKSGKGYVAYVVAISPDYGTNETETLIHFGSDGKIVGTKKVLWKTSDAIYGYVPPTEDAVNAFYAKFVGKSSDEFKAAFTGEGVELVSNATKTAERLVSSIAEAFDKVDTLIWQDMPRDEEEVKTLAAELVGAGATFTDVTPKGLSNVKRIYKENGGKGYVAYAVVISTQYGTPETETLIHFNNDGRIAGVKKVVWKTSDAIFGYVPPSEETVDAFYAKFPGKNAGEFKAAFTGEGVELVANATNTATALVTAMIEAFDATDAIIAANTPDPTPAPVDYTPRTVGIIIISVAFAAVAALVVIKIVRRRKI
ncbi:MAG: FMN-binding protein [Clostridia bacterium]|nr:FMN-binding protein [Clostridia bacterium]